MKEQFLQIPEPLQKQILRRCAGTILGLIVFFIILGYGGGWSFLVPAVILIATCLISAGILFYQCANRQYVSVSGIVTDIECTALRRRFKAIYFRAEPHDIKLVASKGIKRIAVGDTIVVYALESTSVYEMDGCQVLCNYLAVSKGG